MPGAPTPGKLSVMDRTQYDLMLQGAPYDGSDPYLLSLQAEAQIRKAAVDAIPTSRPGDRSEALSRLFGSLAGPAVVMPPFVVEYGRHIHLGPWVYINANATLMDSAPITIGERTAIGPNVQLVTPTHPARPEERFLDGDPAGMPPFRVVSLAHPVTIGAFVWIGAGATVLPGVSIGDGAVVGAGAVVTRDVAPRTVVAGNPARVIRSLDA